MAGANPKVDEFLASEKKWREEFTRLREIMLDSPLSEEFKWGKPCYTLENGNVVLIHGFKEYWALLFFKGALLKDPKGILVAQSDNTQATRQIRFTSAQEIAKMAPTIRAYVRQAMDVETAGLKVNFKQTKDFACPEEFQTRLDQQPALKAAFEALTPGRQRAYLLHFSAPKLAKTRISRVEKCLPRILARKGLDD